MRWLLGLAGLLAVLTGPAAGQTVDNDAAEIALWQAVIARNQPSDYQGYLLMFPNGHFAPLARLRAGQDAPAAAPVPQASSRMLRLEKPVVRLVNGVTLDADVSALSASSNLRLVVVARAAPDAIDDTDRFVANSTPIGKGRFRLTIPAGPPGEDEVRLYHITPYASSFTVAARVPVRVQPGYPGATLARDLVGEALATGPVRFEAAHRDRPVLVQGGFLRVWPSSEWNTAWFRGVPVATVQTKLLVISIGLPGALEDRFGSHGEVVCALPASGDMLDRFAAMETGTPVLLRGVPYTWSGAGVREPVPLLDCALQASG